jgi:aminoglycoside phosphotransferase (APT) family kinase protein
MTQNPRPTAANAQEVISCYLRGEVFTLRRFPTGLCHYVYEVVPERSAPVVLRMGHRETRPQLAGSLYWTERLRPLGVPLPAILAAELDGPFPYTILERIPGVDLGDVYPSLGPDARKCIAEAVVHLQGVVQNLPVASGYGFAYGYEDRRLQPSWHDVINQQLNRARQWIEMNGVCDSAHVDRVQSRLPSLRSYFDQVKPTPFLHDTTTKNVLVADSRLVGIVDVDDLCFGDPLLVLALTNMALRARDWDTDYVHHWAHAWNLDKVQHEALRFYTAVFCLTFMGELGQQFNKDSVEVHNDEAHRFEKILDALVS